MIWKFVSERPGSHGQTSDLHIENLYVKIFLNPIFVQNIKVTSTSLFKQTSKLTINVSEKDIAIKTSIRKHQQKYKTNTFLFRKFLKTDYRTEGNKASIPLVKQTSKKRQQK